MKKKSLFRTILFYCIFTLTTFFCGYGLRMLSVDNSIDVQKIYSDHVIPTPKSTQRLHLLQFGRTKEEALAEIENLLSQSGMTGNDYTVGNGKLFSFQSNGDIVWVCDVVIFVKQSFIDEQNKLQHQLELASK